jgi:hypothetical protein
LNSATCSWIVVCDPTARSAEDLRLREGVGLCGVEQLDLGREGHVVIENVFEVEREHHDRQELHQHHEAEQKEGILPAVNSRLILSPRAELVHYQQLYDVVAEPRNVTKANNLNIDLHLW